MSSSPTTFWAGTTRPDGRATSMELFVTRLVGFVVLLLLAPLGLASYILWLGLFLYARMPWWVPAPVAGVMWLGTFTFAGGLGNVLGNHIGVWGSVLTSVGNEDGVGAAVSENWVSWLGSQFWSGALLGTTISAGVLAWKWMRRPKWEERMLRPGPILKRRFQKTAGLIAAGQDSPTDGVTVGVSADRRDPRFAGGSPGAKYGTRAVLKDAESAGHCLVVGGSGSGKALDVDTLIPMGDTARGTFKRMGDLVVGDIVLDENFLDTNVLGAYDVQRGRKCYEVHFSDGSRIIADAEHLWMVRDTREGMRMGEWSVQDTRTLKTAFLWAHDGRPRFEVPPVYQDGAGEKRHIFRNARGIINIQKVDSRPVRCIAVDSPNKLFLAGTSYIPTHNTTTMLMGMRDVIRRGNGLIVVDCKGGPDVPEQLAEWANRYGRRFVHWSITDPRTEYLGPASSPAYYDPISRGDPSRRKDLIIGSQRWDVEYYKTVISDYLQTAFTVMALVPPAEPVDTFKDLADLLNPATLVRRAAPIPKDQYPELFEALSRIVDLGVQERSGISNMYARLNTLMTSTAGSWLRKDPAGENDIDLLQSAYDGDVVVFSLDTSNYEETSNLLAGLVVQDLKTVTSALRAYPAATPVHVYIDEFSAVDASNIYGLLAKARDARMTVTLATQALADLKIRDPHFDSAVVGIVSSFLIHRANQEEDARIYAGLSGLVKKMVHKMGVENTTNTMTGIGAASAVGKGFLEEKEMYRVDPGVFQSLKQGQCVMIAKIPHERFISPVQVIRENEAKASLSSDPALDPERVYPDTIVGKYRDVYNLTQMDLAYQERVQESPIAVFNEPSPSPQASPTERAPMQSEMPEPTENAPAVTTRVPENRVPVRPVTMQKSGTLPSEGGVAGRTAGAPIPGLPDPRETVSTAGVITPITEVEVPETPTVVTDDDDEEWSTV